MQSAWQARHLWHWAGSGGALGSRLARLSPQLFVWLAWRLATSKAWHLWHWAGSGGALGSRGAFVVAAVCVAAWRLATTTFTLSTCILRGRRGTYGTGLALVARLVPVGAVVTAAVCVAGVALGDIDLHFVWQVWHLATSTCILRGRRSTYVTGLALVARLVPVCVAAWHLATSTFTLCGNAFCVAGVALMALGWLWWRAWFPLAPLSPRLFVWQTWRLATSTFTLCGRRGTWRHQPISCVAGVALMALGWLWWRAWFLFVPLLVVLARRLWLHYMITHHLSTTLVFTTL